MNKKNWLLLILVGIMALIVVGVVYYVLNGFPEQSSTLEEQGIIPPETTGEISNLEEALNREMLDEDTLINEEDSDVDIIESDNLEIDEFGQSVDEEEL